MKSINKQINATLSAFFEKGNISLTIANTENLKYEKENFSSLYNSASLELALNIPVKCIKVLLKLKSDDPTSFLKLYYSTTKNKYDDLHSVLLARADSKEYRRNILFPFPVKFFRIQFHDFITDFSILKFAFFYHSVSLYKFSNNLNSLRILLLNSKLRKLFFNKLFKNKQNSFAMELYKEKENEKLKKINLYSPPQPLYNDPQFSLEIRNKIDSFKNKPLFSIIMPVYNTPQILLQKAVHSIMKQWYANWELCIADDASTNQETINYLHSLKKENYYSIKIKFLSLNQNISGASNEALKLASGNFVVLMDHDDELTPHALFEALSVINNSPDCDFIYSDEDKLDINDNHLEHHFKPDFSPDMLMSHNYISHLAIIKRSIVEKVGGWTNGLEGAQDYDLYLKVLEKTKNIIHIPKILYHWRKISGSTANAISEKSFADDAGLKALKSALKRRKIKASVSHGKTKGTYKINYSIKKNQLVSIIIPFKDQPSYLIKCINSILQKSTYSEFEIIAVNNNSSEPQTFDTMNSLKKLSNKIKFVNYNSPFNYSAINNFAVNNFANGNHIIHEQRHSNYNSGMD